MAPDTAVAIVSASEQPHDTEQKLRDYLGANVEVSRVYTSAMRSTCSIASHLYVRIGIPEEKILRIGSVTPAASNAAARNAISTGPFLLESSETWPFSIRDCACL